MQPCLPHLIAYVETKGRVFRAIKECRMSGSPVRDGSIEVYMGLGRVELPTSRLSGRFIRT